MVLCDGEEFRDVLGMSIDVGIIGLWKMEMVESMDCVTVWMIEWIVVWEQMIKSHVLVVRIQLLLAGNPDPEVGSEEPVLHAGDAAAALPRDLEAQRSRFSPAI